jgi:hypothetical protein
MMRTKIWTVINFFFLALLLPVFQIFGQAWDEEGEIDDAEVVIEKSLEIKLPHIPRNFEKIPPLPAESHANLVQKYEFRDVNGNLPVLALHPRALKLKDEPLEKLFRGYARGGFGNYTTPELNVYVYNKREKSHLAGIRFNHRSSGQGPVDRKNSSNGFTSFEIAGNHYRGPLTIGAEAGYDHSFWNFYGYPDGLSVDTDSIRQKYKRIHILGHIQNSPAAGKPGFRLSAGYSNLADRFGQSESAIRSDLLIKVPVREGLLFYLYADALFSARRTSGNEYRSLLKFRPSVYYKYDNLDVEGGLNSVLQNDTIASRGPVILYPYIDLEYHISNRISGFLKIDGDMEEVTFNSIASVNPYIDKEIALCHTNKKFGIDWGFTANLGNLAYAKAGFAFGSYKDMNFFINDSLDFSRFDLVYDPGSTSVTNLYGEINLSESKVYMVNLKGGIFNYKTDVVEKAWHKPRWRIDILSRYNIYQKVVLSADLYFMGGIPVKVPVGVNPEQEIILDSVSDLNFTIDYLFSEKFSVFLDFRNMLGKSYEIYWRYPSRGLQFMAGASINF